MKQNETLKLEPYVEPVEDAYDSFTPNQMDIINMVSSDTDYWYAPAGVNRGLIIDSPEDEQYYIVHKSYQISYDATKQRWSMSKDE